MLAYLKSFLPELMIPFNLVAWKGMSSQILIHSQPKKEMENFVGTNLRIITQEKNPSENSEDCSTWDRSRHS